VRLGWGQLWPWQHEKEGREHSGALGGSGGGVTAPPLRDLSRVNYAVYQICRRVVLSVPWDGGHGQDTTPRGGHAVVPNTS
jgi:hypothetical protein